MDVRTSFTALWLPAVFPLLLYGCTPTAARPSQEVRATVSDRVSSVTAGTSPEQTDLARLAELWRQRQGHIVDYPIGPGDVIEISVPAMKELESRTVRVSGEGTISLPFIGTVPVKDLTEDQLSEQLRQHLDKYMYDPQVNVFVKEYRSRQAAVIGAVQKPGLYNLASGADTILDVLALAGGLSTNAAQRILFIPAEPLDGRKAKELASLFPVQLGSPAPSPLFLKKVDPLVIDLQLLSNGEGQIYLTMPARPGDIFLIPGAGDVLIDGWVEKPGAYKITSGLTLLAAVAAAGGPLFPADTNTVKILRTEKDGVRTFFFADLEKIKHGEQEDPRVQEGDVIEIASSTTKMIPYAVSRFFSTIFHVGGSVPIF